MGLQRVSDADSRPFSFAPRGLRRFWHGPALLSWPRSISDSGAAFAPWPVPKSAQRGPCQYFNRLLKIFALWWRNEAAFRFASLVVATALQAWPLLRIRCSRFFFRFQVSAFRFCFPHSLLSHWSLVISPPPGRCYASVAAALCRWKPAPQPATRCRDYQPDSRLAGQTGVRAAGV